MDCWTCGVQLEEPLYGKISFRAECDRCGAALHCCSNCKFYKPGLPNDCMVPGTEFIADRTAANLCEEFSVLGRFIPKKEVNKKGFNDLFKEG